VLGPNNAAIVDYLLQNVVAQGTGVRAQLPDGRPVAGKTGTTENYGDAWFVGYTPQLAVAVWVGYPHRLVPMLSEFHGQPVAGGTFPALIWKSFMERALPYLHDQPESFPAPQFPYASPKRLVLRDGRWQLDNGNCRNTILVSYFTGFGPKQTAGCKHNEVEVPSVLGLSYSDARSRLALQPLDAQPVYKPAGAGQEVGVVLAEIPKVGARLSSFDTVQLVLAKAVHGVVPDLIGMPVNAARSKLARLRVRVRVRAGPFTRQAGRVIWQTPRPGLAAAPHMRVMLVVSRKAHPRTGGSRSGSRQARTATAAR
jgi:membrane peptidoglycan carboxypeptidase